MSLNFKQEIHYQIQMGAISILMSPHADEYSILKRSHERHHCNHSAVEVVSSISIIEVDIIFSKQIAVN